MSYIGKSPSLKRTRYEPQSADPVNPQDGDFFHSDGTPRAEGPWVYFNGAWQQVSTSGALATVNNLTFTPQAADPGSPTVGMVFFADGTSRAEGLWLYTDTGWHQLSGVRYVEFTTGDIFQVRAASTVNVLLASQVENGDSFGGVTLATGNFVLLKNQTTTTENGIYIVQVSGAPVRHASFDSAAELSVAAIRVMEGTNANTRWFQNNTLATLSDPQSWSALPTVGTFTVPGDVTEIRMVGIGGGGGGQGGGRTGAFSGTGGSGGGGSIPFTKLIPVTPGETFTVTLGAGGLGGAGGASGGPGANGTVGGTTTVTRTSINEVVLRAEGGNLGAPVPAGASWSPAAQLVGGGQGGASVNGAVGDDSWFANGGRAGLMVSSRGGGGGGGPGYDDGGDGGSTTTYIFTVPSSSIKAGTTYTNNGQTFKVTITTSNSTSLKCSGTGAPSASGTLTFVSGLTAGNVAFSAFSTSATTNDRFGMAGTRGAGGGGGGSGSQQSGDGGGMGGDGGYGYVQIYW